MWKNLAIGKTYTLDAPTNPYLDGNASRSITDTDSDYATSSGFLTDGHYGGPLDYHRNYSGAVLWSAPGNTPGVQMRLDMGADTGGGFVRVWGTHYYDDGPVLYAEIEVEYSDNDSTWTSVKAKTGMTRSVSGDGGQWIADIDISAAGDHRYWRVTLGEDFAAPYQWIALTQVEFWADEAAAGGGGAGGAGILLLGCG